MHLNVGTGIVVSSGNSTTGALGASQSFVGATEKIDSFEEITVNLAGAPTNAPGDFYYEFSPDGTHWDTSVWVGGAQLSGPVLPPQILRIVLPYFRVRYINGASPMTELRLTTVYHRVGSMRLSRYLNQSITDTEPVQNVRSVMSFRDVASGSYVNVSSLVPLPITGTIGLNPQAVITASVVAATVTTGSAGLAVGNAPYSPLYVTGSVALNPTPVITANTATTGTTGLAVGNAPYQPLWITVTGSLPVTGGLVSVVTPTTSSGTPFVLMTTEPTVAHRFDINYDTTSDVNNWYYGYAELGSSDSAAVWTIKRVSVSAGIATAARWSPSGQIWNNRASATYT